MPTIDELNGAWAEEVLGQVPRGTKARFLAGRFLTVDDAAVLALPNEPHRDRCQAVRGEVEDALASHFGRPVALRLVVETDPDDLDSAVGRIDRISPASAGDRSGQNDAASVEEEEEEIHNVDQLDDADVAATGVERLLEAFPGAKVIDPDQGAG